MKTFQIYQIKSHNVKKKLNGGLTFGFFNIHSVTKYQKIEGGPFADINKISEKKSHKAETRHKCVHGDVALISLVE